MKRVLAGCLRSIADGLAPQAPVQVTQNITVSGRMSPAALAVAKTRFAAAVNANDQANQQFLADLRTLVARGFPLLAVDLLREGNVDAREIAAEFTRWVAKSKP